MPAGTAGVLRVATGEEQPGLLVTLPLEVMTQVGGRVGRKLGREAIDPLEQWHQRRSRAPALYRGGGAIEIEEGVEDGLFRRGHRPAG